jgi:hypothetical protein
MPFQFEDAIVVEELLGEAFFVVNETFQAAFARVDQLLDIQHTIAVEICFHQQDSGCPIGGFASSHDKLEIYIDPDQAQYSDPEWHSELVSAIHHEGNHNKRCTKLMTELDGTLQEALVAEGVAVLFQEEQGLFPRALLKVISSFDRDALQALFDQAQHEFDNRNYSHDRWFPSGKGYALGLALVKGYAVKNGLTAAPLVCIGPSTIINAYLRGEFELIPTPDLDNASQAYRPIETREISTSLASSLIQQM